jgi:hypothetical protein
MSPTNLPSPRLLGMKRDDRFVLSSCRLLNRPLFFAHDAGRNRGAFQYISEIATVVVAQTAQPDARPNALRLRSSFPLT